MDRKVFDRDAVARYAVASGDDNPIHLSDHAARTGGLDGAIAHGMLVLGWAAAQLDLPDDGYALDARFVAPVPVGTAGVLTIDGPGQARVVREDGTDAVCLQYTASIASDRLTLPEGAEIVAKVAVSPRHETLEAFAEAIDARAGLPTLPFALTAVGFLPDDPANAGVRPPYPVTDCARWVGSDRPALHGGQVITASRPFAPGERLLARTAVLSRSRRARGSGGSLAFTAIRTTFAEPDGLVIAASEMNLIVVEDD